MIATDEVRRLKTEAQFETLITPWTLEDTADNIAYTTVWNTKSCNLGFVAGKGAAFFKLVKERIQIHTNVKTKAQKTGDVAAARLIAKSTQPYKLGGDLKRESKVAKLEMDTSVIKQKKSKLEPALQAKDTILAVHASSASESAVIEI